MAKSIEQELRAVSKKLVSLQKTVEKLAAAAGKNKAPAAPKVKAVAKAKSSSKEKKSKPGKEPTAAETVMGFIRRSRKGIDTGTLIEKTGFNQKKIANIIYKLKKQGVIKSPEKGVYVKA